MANSNLTNAKTAKNDEFYTQYRDIEDEMRGYIKHNPKAFKGKTILLPCDDPEWSNFTKYFAQNFDKLGLKKLISTSYSPNSRQIIKENAQLALFGTDSPKYDKSRHASHGRIFTLERDRTGDGRTNYEDIEWNYLKGDGDFRSDEVKALRDEADIIITNPPFSLFREFLSWINEANKKFIMMGNINAITYKDVFPLLKDDKMWLGFGKSKKRCFEVPDSYAGKVIIEDGKRLKGLGLTCWFTNIEHARRHEGILNLMTKADNKKFRDISYQKYDNYCAIDVSLTNAIPSDHKGVMGVPISFLDKYSPEQFEIVKFRHGNDGKDLRLQDGTCPYFRILIKHRSPAK
jgi:hypothetical protein